MQKYRSHKVVEASPIVTFGVKGNIIAVTVQGGEIVEAPWDLLSRGAPVTGDYLVRYEDGYLSWSPKKAFEAGYTALDG